MDGTPRKTGWTFSEGFGRLEKFGQKNSGRTDGSTSAPGASALGAVFRLGDRMAVNRWSKLRVFGGRGSGTVSAASGDYVDVLFLGKVGSGERVGSFDEIGVLVEAIPALATVEVWLPRWSGDGAAAADQADADYTNGGFTTLSAGSTGFFRVLVAGWGGALIRCKSGGATGTVTVSATAL